MSEIPRELDVDEQRRLAAVDRAIDAMRGTGFEVVPEALLELARHIETFVASGDVPQPGSHDAPPADAEPADVD